MDKELLNNILMNVQENVKRLCDHATLASSEVYWSNDPAAMRQLARQLERACEQVNNKLNGLQGKLNSGAFGK